VVTVTSTVPATPAGEVAVQVVVVEQLTEVSAVSRRPPWSSHTKPVPVM